MWELLGLDQKSQARGEVGSLNDTRSDFETWDLGDRIRSAITGVSREDLLKDSGALRTQELNRNTLDDRGRIQDSLAGTQVDTSGLEIRAGETEADHLSRLSRLLRTGQAVDRIEATVENFDRTSVKPGATASTVQQLGRTTIDSNKEADEKKVEAETRYQEGRADSKYRDSQDIMLLQLSNQAADRQADKEYRRDQQAYQNRKLDLQEARYDRKDRQAVIQQLMAGLAQMGASIAI